MSTFVVSESLMVKCCGLCVSLLKLLARLSVQNLRAAFNLTFWTIVIQYSSQDLHSQPGIVL